MKEAGLFFDEAVIVVRGGKGGDGCVAFRREKYVPFGGPSGGSGGAGGNVYLRAKAGINTLVAFRRRHRFVAQDGEAGQGQGRHGKSGADLYVDVPLGTVVRDMATGETLADLTVDGQTFLAARGGRAGRGNEAFKSATRQAPHFAEKGEPGEERTLRLELKLLADVGLVGKPNAGKSTLLARVSAARPRIADYAFTTLTPVLGVVDMGETSFVMADIPGLIEGAHAGAGLGLQFLRHVERTRLLVHLLDGSSPDPIADYQAINRELAMYDEALGRKPQILVVNKIDLPEARARVQEIQAALDEQVGQIYSISAASGEGVNDLLIAIAERLRALLEEEPGEQMVVLRPQATEERAFQVLREGPGVFRVVGEEIERLALMTDWENEEAIERFERIMLARGISAELDASGVQVGDTVYIGDVELEWR